MTTDAPESYSENFDIIVTNEGFYLGETLVSRRNVNGQLEKPWWRRFDFDQEAFDYIQRIGKETPSSKFSTPSGQTRIDCSNPAIFNVSK